MRAPLAPLAPLLALALAFAGCLDIGGGAGTDAGGAGSDAGGAGDEPPVAEAYGLPDTLRAQGMVPLGFEWTCIQPCPAYPFTLEGRTAVEVVLEWTLPTNDVDLFIYSSSGQVVAESIDFIPQTSERISIVLDAGDYTISVEPWWSAPGDPFTLTAGFAYP